MKKLLVALFVLGSVTALANGAEELKDPNCYTSACKTEQEFNVHVKIPQKLIISRIGDIDIGAWCGTKETSKSADFHITGEKDASIDVKVYGQNSAFQWKEGELHFKNGIIPTGITGDINVAIPSTLDNGKADGTITAKMNPLMLPGPTTLAYTGKTLTAKAKLVAKYDDSSWGL